MCGITGIVNYKKNILEQKDILNEMTSTLAKRGPNQDGYYTSNHCLLGHRRLIVVDPSGGLQPMTKCTEGYNYVIVYNGELYNTEEVRGSLKSLGYTFNSYSDTEVLLTSYIAWGTECLKHINGIFAFGIWDEKRQSLFLARDPLGVKPLFYTLCGDTLIFGSELKTLLKHPLVKPEIDETGICEILGLGPAHDENSGVFKNVYQLPPANYLIYNKFNFKKIEYWKLKNMDHTESEKETLEHIRFLVVDSIKRQLISDVPVCTFLSGGLDSSIISTIAAQEFKKNGNILDTYSIDYKGNKENFISDDYLPTSDDEWVDVMYQYIGSNHHKILLDNTDLLNALENAVKASDLPGMADIDSSLFLFCKEISKNAVVALSGECADEIFGGYPWYIRPELKSLDTFPWSNAIKERKSIINKNLSSIDLEGYVQNQYESTIKRLPLSSYDSTSSDYAAKKMFFLNIKWFMTTLLTRKDRMSMSNSLEVRVPFADYRIVEYAFNLPEKLKFYNNREKGLLRKALTGLLPEDVLWRKKSPYPKTFSPDYTRGVQDWMNIILSDNSSPILQLIDKANVQDIVNTGGKSFGKPWFGQLMTGPQMLAYLIQIDLWMRHYNVKISI
ncbi:asparagine synthase (glutamine-hydrolyzing) [Clostridium sp. 19966]|uniref:asparagine synthase (glutamine-hydrolyzing) n=1 Tax=Clostridium sp. 19966 TaxID=2768166 RepID=UPI0028DEF2D9|nr:asparagine synthase (glutamine-hydrolyzing) [Clostridium sp. 19966]MDT8718095.1 asparagine synthase (glutamine-hydrolyzing) [Clostridium sp. 19966]